MEKLWEDENIVVVNKPAGVVVDGKLGLIAHRLDKETTGCLLIAKTSEAQQFLQSQFKKREIHKEYLAIVHGCIEPKKGTIRLPIGRSKRDRRRQEIRFDGKLAETSWERLSYDRDTDCSVVRLFPKTGRMHQIRVHLSHIHFPIFADDKYLGGAQKAEDRKLINHHFLHAETIGFKDMSGKMRVIKSNCLSEIG